MRLPALLVLTVLITWYDIWDMKTAKKNGAVKKKAPTKKTAKKKAVKRQKGRPTIFTTKLGELINFRIAEGESLRNICLDETMPNRSSVHLWLIQGKAEEATQELKDFSDQYELAVEVRAENMFDELEAIADDGSNDWMEKELNNGHIIDVVNSEHIQRSRLRTDVRKWKLSKMLPKRFGDRTTLNTEDKDGNIVPISGNIIQFASQNNNESES